MKMILNKHSNTSLQLTVREKECLYWSAMGKSAEETGLILNVKAHTVISYRKRIKTKLNCITMAQAVYTAIKCGEFF